MLAKNLPVRDGDEGAFSPKNLYLKGEWDGMR
jgi:hypothetical protein